MGERALIDAALFGEPLGRLKGSAGPRAGPATLGNFLFFIYCKTVVDQSQFSFVFLTSYGLTVHATETPQVQYNLVSCIKGRKAVVAQPYGGV